MGLRAFIAAAGLFFGLCFGGTARAETVFTTFNIRWYGLGGAMAGDPRQEQRDPFLKEFLFNVTRVGLSDVIAFQEIVDVPRLRRLLPGHQCVSYDGRDPKHQHVVICVKSPLRLEKEPFDDNFAIEDIILPIPGGKLRPAVHGLLKSAAGKPLAHLIAVHLKAQPNETRLRLQQLDILKKHVETRLNDGLPIVMMGDFNTHIKSATRFPKDDEALFSDILAKGRVKMKRASNPFPYTYRTNQHASHFDHFWISDPVRPLAPAAVWTTCNSPSRGARYENLDFYYKNVSDHCPVVVRLPL